MKYIFSPTSIEAKIAELEHLLLPYKQVWQSEVLSNYLKNKDNIELPDYELSEEDCLGLSQMAHLPKQHHWHDLSLKLQQACKLPSSPYYQEIFNKK